MIAEQAIKLGRQYGAKASGVEFASSILASGIPYGGKLLVSSPIARGFAKSVHKIIPTKSFQTGVAHKMFDTIKTAANNSCYKGTTVGTALTIANGFQEGMEESFVESMNMNMMEDKFPEFKRSTEEEKRK